MTKAIKHDDNKPDCEPVGELGRVAIKADDGKPDLGIIPLPAMEALAYALMYGEKKYSRNNFRAGFDTNRLVASSLRHIYQWQNGEDLDPESGVSHLGHALASLTMLVTNLAEGVAIDGRYHIQGGYLNQAEISGIRLQEQEESPCLTIEKDSQDDIPLTKEEGDILRAEANRIVANDKYGRIDLASYLAKRRKSLLNKRHLKELAESKFQLKEDLGESRPTEAEWADILASPYYPDSLRGETKQNLADDRLVGFQVRSQKTTY